jgi:hypothetical protein
MWAVMHGNPTFADAASRNPLAAMHVQAPARAPAPPSLAAGVSPGLAVRSAFKVLMHKPPACVPASRGGEASHAKVAAQQPGCWCWSWITRADPRAPRQRGPPPRRRPLTSAMLPGPRPVVRRAVATAMVE